MKRAGFTLIEMMVVLAVIALVVVISVPAFVKQVSASPLDQGVQDFQGVCRKARQQAVVSGRSVEVAVFLMNEVTVVATRLDPPTLEDQLIGEEFHRSVVDRLELPEAVKVKVANDQWEPDEEGAVRFRFHPNGTCDYMALLMADDSGDEYFVDMVEPSGRARVGQLED